MQPAECRDVGPVLVDADDSTPAHCFSRTIRFCPTRPAAPVMMIRFFAVTT
jgi:hypothetical protein